MDNLAINIFVPESKSASKAIKTKQKASKPHAAKLTVVKSSSKLQDSLKKVPKNVANPNNTKKSPFIKTKVSKEVNSKPFLLSEMFNRNEMSTSSVAKDEETFSVSFVKPRLFQKNSEPIKNKGWGSSVKPNQKEAIREIAQNSLENKGSETGGNTTGSGEFKVSFVKPKLFQKTSASKETRSDNKWDKMIQKVHANKDSDRSEERRSEDFNDEVVNLDDDFSTGFNDDSRKQTSNKNRGSALFEEGGWKSNKSTNKWFGNSSSQSGKIQVDFPIETTSVGNKSKKTDERVVKKTGNLKRKFEDDSSVQKKRRRETAGPMSSLFSYDTAVEPLQNADIEPWEERLFSKQTFKDAGVHPHLVGNLEQLFGITNMTVVQKKTLPELLSGKDGLVRSQTGSGKTLAYAIPIMHSLQLATPKLTRKDGVKALIVLPTRELALQTYECFVKLMRAFTWIVPGIVIGGEKRKSEKVRLRKGITVLIGTPGRLLDHAQHSENLSLHGIDWLIIDEADKLLEMGYEKDISQLMSIIDSQREKAEKVGRKQTVLLSATLTSAVEKLANLALKNPVHIDACKNIQETTDVMVIPQSLEQKYVVVPAKMRLVALASFIIEVTELRQQSNKVLVFMATQDMVDFYMDLIPSVLSSTVKFFKLHGNMSQGDRTEVFNSFRKSEKGVLLSTDVAARGLDLPMVDWIVQYTAPTTPSEYVHRVGRTARVGTTGSSLLFLLPSELHFVSMLNSSRLKLDEVNLDVYLKCLMKIHLESRDGQRWGGGIEGAATVLQHNFENAIIEDKALHDIACKAYKSWVRFYATYPKDLRVVFDFKSLHLGHNAKSFALRDPPRAIGGIGKPKKGEKWGKGTDMRPIRKRKNDHLGHVTESSRTKKLILSEFDSGLKTPKKMK